LNAIDEAGILGIKFHPAHQGFVVDEPKYQSLFRSIASRGLFVMFHAGYDWGYPEHDGAAPRRLAKLRHNVPELTMIAAHLGGFLAWDEVIECLVGSEVYFDTSFMHLASREQREQILLHHGVSRILFGSDSPWTSQKDSVEQVLALPLDAKQQSQVLCENAELLVSRVESTRMQRLVKSTCGRLRKDCAVRLPG
jgi:predicted TIM-barrel fold metal-dependent hydrolase